MRFWHIPIFLICSFPIQSADVPSVTPGTSVRRPLLGYVQLAPGEIRPVTGFIGANVVQDNVVAADMAVFPAGSQPYAIVRAGDASPAGVARLDENGLGPVTAIPEAFGAMERAVFSASGESVILMAEGRLQVITGLPDQPRIASNVNLSEIPGTFVTATVSDDGQTIAAAFANGETARLDEIRGNQRRTLIERPSVAAVRYVPASGALLIADAASNEVLLLDKDGAEPLILAGAAEGVSGPADIETSKDGRIVFVANSAANLIMIDRETGETRVLPCGFAPVAFQRLARSAVAIVAREGASVAVLDTDAEAPWVAYAPKVRR